jgi:hypothetical protein
MGIIYVNSTLDAARSLLPSGQISPVHYWGYLPQGEDRVYYHRRTRLGIVMRSYLGGVDIPILGRVLLDLAAGVRSIYLVTQPDLMRALPLIRKLFPRCRIVTWAWIPEEVDKFKASLRCCTHVLCLTEAAFSRMKTELPGTGASLELWGADPAFYRMEPQPILYDVALVGLANRDLTLTKAALNEPGHSVVASKSAFDRLGTEPSENVVTVAFESAGDIIRCLYQSRVTWIPLNVGDHYPTGYTNLIEGLLCGSCVVITSASMLPRQVLELPGVYLYEAGSVESLLWQTDAAIKASRAPGFRDRVRDAAAAILNARALYQAVEVALGAGIGSYPGSL